VTVGVTVDAAAISVSAEYEKVANAKATLTAPLKAIAGKPVTLSAVGSTSNDSSVTYEFVVPGFAGQNTTAKTYTFTPTAVNPSLGVALNIKKGSDVLASKSASIEVVTEASVNNTLCIGCHSGSTPAVIAAYNAGTHGNTGLSCISCHTESPHADASEPVTLKSSSVAASHAMVGQVAVAVASVVAGVDNVVMTFNVKKDGVNADNFTFSPSGYRYAASATPTSGTVTADFTRTTAAPVVAALGNGNYTATWAGTPPAGATTYMVSVYNAAAAPRQLASAVGYLNGNPRNIASNDGCINCHGNNAFSGRATAPNTYAHYGANPQGVEACVVCHTRATSVSRGAGGDRTTAYVHGIHNSHNMPGGGYDRTFPVPTPKVNDFEVTYPTYMTNCSVCHTTPAQLAIINAAVVSYSLCMSCHDGWTGFGTALNNKPDHTGYTAATSCVGCHAGDTAATIHNNRLTERSGVIYNGQDTSVTEGAKVDMQITGASRSGNNLVFTWTAKYNNIPVNPCNAVATTTAPTFHAAVANATTGQANGGFSALLAYAQGDDFINPGIGTAPGQPLSVNLTTSNTVCADNVATSTVAMTAPELLMTRGRVAIQGKAQLDLSAAYPGIDTNTTAAGTQPVDQVRSKSPTREFMVADGSLPAATRRPIIDSASCLKCHVGSMYQHGGNRVDNLDLCVMCHNEASSEQNVRHLDGIDASEAYDGKPGQTYGFKSLLHAVHSAGVNGAITMVHRVQGGNYVWTGPDTVIPNYPGTGLQVIYGSSNSSGQPVSRVHNLHSATYPQALNNCAACHVPGSFGLPDPAKAVATTLNVGTLAPTQVQTHANYGIQTDDTLQGPAAAACISCHQSGDAVKQAALEAHIYNNGFFPTQMTGGRAEVINGVVAESCALCHK
jgi:OmcA/MtrC family decaheme c-type cytochrome